jgi:predicted nucleotidyltransferase
VTLNNPSDQELAQRVVQSYLGLPGLSVALIAGSVARGIADESSDLDIYLYWERPDRELLCRLNRLKSFGSERLIAVVTPTGVFEKHRLGHRMIDVESVDVSAIEKVVDWLDCGTAMTPIVEKTVIGIIDGIAVVGQQTLTHWQRRLRYSDALARAQVEAHVGGLLPPVLLYKLTHGRGDALSFSARMSAVLLHAVALVAAANRAFVPVNEPKWLPWQLGRLSHVPPRMIERMNDALLYPSVDTMGDLEVLLGEVLDLVERHVSDADTSVGRFVLSMS